MRMWAERSGINVEENYTMQMGNDELLLFSRSEINEKEETFSPSLAGISCHNSNSKDVAHDLFFTVDLLVLMVHWLVFQYQQHQTVRSLRVHLYLLNFVVWRATKNDRTIKFDFCSRNLIKPVLLSFVCVVLCSNLHDVYVILRCQVLDVCSFSDVHRLTFFFRGYSTEWMWNPMKLV